MNTQITLLSLAQTQEVSGGVEPLTNPNYVPVPPSPIDHRDGIWVVGDRGFIGPRNPFGESNEVYN